MSDQDSTQALREALKLSPDNLPIRLLLVQALVSQSELMEASSLLYEAPDLTIEKDEQQRMVANVFLNVGDPKRAIHVLNAESGENLLLKARAYFMLDDLDAAKEFYRKAITENSTLEDPKLAELIKEDIEPLIPKREAQKVEANDDTDEYEMTRILEPSGDSVTFDDVGGLEKVKSQIRKKIITPFQKPSLFQRFKKKVGGGILLYGPPGCGKTLMARATAGQCKAKFFNVAISDILDMYIGESEQKLHSIFSAAREQSPAVIFFDEVEALAGKRQFSREQTSSKLVSQFLSELDGFSQNNDGVLILAATNVPWALDSAFRRPGRFDRIVFIPPPDREARLAILKVLIKDRPGAERIDLDPLAKKTSGFSGADLKNLIESAVDCAIDESLAEGKEIPLKTSHFTEALEDVKPTTLEWLTTARNYARYANESGQYNDVLDFLKKNAK